MAVAFIGVRRASEVTQLVGGDVFLDDGRILVQLRLKRQKNGRPGAAPTSHLVSVDSRGVASPVKLPSGCLWLRGWLRDHHGHAGRLSGAEKSNPFLAGLARAKLVWEWQLWGLRRRGKRC